MKIKKIFSFVCETVVLSKNNTLSIINIIENIRPRALPMTMPQLVVVSQFESSKTTEDGMFKLEIQIIDPDGENLLKNRNSIIELKISPENKKGNSVFVVNGLIFEKKGEYNIKFFKEGDFLCDGQKFFVNMN